jgi:hypothetical protein
VSQVAQDAATEHSGDANHGTLVRAAAQACGKEEAPTPEASGSPTSAPSHAREGKALGKGHGTGKPTGVPPQR